MKFAFFSLQVKLPRVSGVVPHVTSPMASHVPSPLTSLSLQASSLSLDSPAAATRSRARLQPQVRPGRLRIIRFFISGIRPDFDIASQITGQIIYRG